MELVTQDQASRQPRPTRGICPNFPDYKLQKTNKVQIWCCMCKYSCKPLAARTSHTTNIQQQTFKLFGHFSNICETPCWWSGWGYNDPVSPPRVSTSRIGPAVDIDWIHIIWWEQEKIIIYFTSSIFLPFHNLSIPLLYSCASRRCAGGDRVTIEIFYKHLFTGASSARSGRGRLS